MRWCRFHGQVKSLKWAQSQTPAETGDSSADRHDFCAESIRSDGPPVTGGPLLLLSPGEQVLLFTDGACLPFSHVGGWAFMLKHANSGKQVGRYGGISRTTNNRAELLAVIYGLESLRQPARVCVVTTSQISQSPTHYNVASLAKIGITPDELGRPGPPKRSCLAQSPSAPVCRRSG